MQVQVPERSIHTQKELDRTGFISPYNGETSVLDSNQHLALFVAQRSIANSLQQDCKALEYKCWGEVIVMKG